MLERRAATLLKLKKYDECLLDCKSALKIDNKFAAAYFVRGQVEKCKDNKDEALDDFTKALENSRERADVLTARGETIAPRPRPSRTPTRPPRSSRRRRTISTAP